MEVHFARDGKFHGLNAGAEEAGRKWAKSLNQVRYLTQLLFNSVNDYRKPLAAEGGK